MNGLTRQNLPSLRSLDLHGNELSSINSLHVPTLRQLFLASNSLTNIDGLGGLPQLTTLHLRNNQIALLDGFTSDLESLQYINLRWNHLSLSLCLSLLLFSSFFSIDTHYNYYHFLLLLWQEQSHCWVTRDWQAQVSPVSKSS